MLSMALNLSKVKTLRTATCRFLTSCQAAKEALEKITSKTLPLLFGSCCPSFSVTDKHLIISLSTNSDRINFCDLSSRSV